MYAIGKAQNALCSAVTILFDSDSSIKLKSVQNTTAIARSVLEQLNLNPHRTTDFCKEIICNKFCDLKRTFPQEAFEIYFSKRDEFWSETDELSVPILDNRFRAFDKLAIDNVLSKLTRRLGLPNFSPCSVSKEYFFAGPVKINITSTLSLILSINGRMDGSPIIDGDITALHNQEEIAAIGAARLVDVGFWRPCKKNTLATEEELQDSFSELLMVFKATISAFKRCYD